MLKYSTGEGGHQSPIEMQEFAGVHGNQIKLKESSPLNESASTSQQATTIQQQINTSESFTELTTYNQQPGDDSLLY